MNYSIYHCQLFPPSISSFRQRRREKKRNKDGDMKPDDDQNFPASNVSKGRGFSRTKNPKRTQGKTISTKTYKTDDELAVQELESTDDEGEQRLEEEKMEEDDEREKSGAPQRTGRVVVVKPKESRSSILKRKAESQTEADEHEEEYPEDVRILKIHPFFFLIINAIGQKRYYHHIVGGVIKPCHSNFL